MNRSLASLAGAPLLATLAAAVPARACVVTFYTSQAPFFAAAPGYTPENFASVDPGPGGQVSFDAPLLIGGTTYDTGSDGPPDYGSSALSAGGVGWYGQDGNTQTAFGPSSSGDSLILTFLSSQSVFASGLYDFFGGDQEAGVQIVVRTDDPNAAPLATYSLNPSADDDPTFIGLTSTVPFTEIDFIPLGDLDQVALAAIPEPMSLAFLGVGLLGLAMTRRTAS